MDRIMAKTYAGSEKRKHPRLGENVPLLYEAPETSEIKTSSTINISGGGFCFETEFCLSPGNILKTQIYKPIDDPSTARLPIYATAKVMWIKQIEIGRYESGLQFIDIDEKHRDEIIRDVGEKLKS